MTPLEKKGRGTVRTARALPAAAERLARRGVPASAGLASGPAHRILPPERLAEDDLPLAPGEEKAEVRRFRLSVRRALDEIQALRECLLSDPGDPGLKILDVHRMLLDDQEFQKQVLSEIRGQHRTGSAAVHRVLHQTIERLQAADSEYFRARSADLQDVERRLLRHLEGEAPMAAPIPRGAIVVASELSPSETTSFDPEAVRALVTDHGGPTSHAAILARSRGIPAVVGLGDLAGQVREGDSILVDGHSGLVVVRPSREEQRAFDLRWRREAKRLQVAAARGQGPAVTMDGHPVTLLANIEVPEDVSMVLQAEADGIGLYRTEFFYLKGRNLPDEEGQYRAYRSIIQRLRPRPVTIRTLDAGGDKFAAYLGTSRENNPFLGLRGIRFSLGHADIFRTQIRAILRASAHGPVQILFPMVSSLEEVRAANQFVDEALKELAREGIPVPRRVERGVMIEVPAAVALADMLARETDFFSIGSNDLIQYTLAVDRENEKLAYLYDPFHPAVLRALAVTIDAANRAGIPVSSCGEMSGSLHGAAVLIGLGCTRLSMSSVHIPAVRDLVRRVRLVDLRRLADDVVHRATVAEVRGIIEESLASVIGGEEGGARRPLSGRAVGRGTPGGSHEG